MCLLVDVRVNHTCCDPAVGCFNFVFEMILK